MNLIPKSKIFLCLILNRRAEEPTATDHPVAGDVLDYMDYMAGPWPLFEKNILKSGF